MIYIILCLYSYQEKIQTLKYLLKVPVISKADEFLGLYGIRHEMVRAEGNIACGRRTRRSDTVVGSEKLPYEKMTPVKILV